MKHNFKPGDRAYWLARNRWVELEKAADCNPDEYVIQVKGHGFSFTSDGKKFLEDETVALLPLNPYDPADPNNPQEFHWPFMLNGKPVFEGSELHHLGYRKTSVVTALFLGDGKQWCGLKNTSVGELSPKNFCWPDEIPAKKKVAKWAYPIGIKGITTVEFTEEMTKEEAVKIYGSGAQMIPGTEREVEG